MIKAKILKLQILLKETDEAKTATASKLQKIEEFISFAYSKVDRIQNDNTELRAQLAAVTTAHSSLQSQLELLHQKASGYCLQIDDLEVKLQLMQIEKENAMMKIKALEEEMCQTRAAHAMERNQFSSNEARLSSELKAMEAQFNSLKVSHRSIEQECCERSDKVRLLAETNDELSERVAALLGRVQCNDEQLEELILEKQGVEKDLEDKGQQLEGASLLIDEMRAMCSQLQVRLQDLEIEKNVTEGALQTAKAELQNNKEELQLAEEAHIANASKLEAGIAFGQDQLQLALDAYEAKISEMKAHHDQQLAQHTSDTANHFQALQDKHQEQIDDAYKKQCALEAQVVELEKAMVDSSQAAESAAKEADRSISELMCRLDASNDRSANLQERCSDLIRQLEVKDELLENKSGALRGKEAEVTELLLRLKDVEDELGQKTHFLAGIQSMATTAVVGGNSSKHPKSYGRQAGPQPASPFAAPEESDSDDDIDAVIDSQALILHGASNHRGPIVQEVNSDEEERVQHRAKKPRRHAASLTTAKTKVVSTRGRRLAKMRSSTAAKEKYASIPTASKLGTKAKAVSGSILGSLFGSFSPYGFGIAPTPSE